MLAPSVLQLEHQALFVPNRALRVRLLQEAVRLGVNGSWKLMEMFQQEHQDRISLRLGDSAARTSTVYDTTNPVWPTTEPASKLHAELIVTFAVSACARTGAYLVTHHREQQLSVEVCGSW